MEKHKQNPVIAWIARHDDSTLFVILYIVLAVILSVFISLFWLVAVVGVHFLFEWIKFSQIEKSAFKILKNTLWEVKLDIVLILFAVFLSLYLDFIFGIVGLGAATRSIAHTGSRIAAWQRGLRGVLMSLDDVAQLSKLRIKKTPVKNGNTPLTTKGEDSSKKGIGDFLVLSFLVVFTLLIIMTPYLTNHSYESMFGLLLQEFSPFP